MPQIPQFTDDLGFIARLGDNPNTDDGLSSQALKEEFDKAPKAIQQFINNYVIPALNNYIMGNGYLQTEGGYMSGPIVMQGNKITLLGTPEADGDAVPKSYADKLFPNIVGIDRGGTGATTAAQARANLGAAPTSHSHKPADISEVIPITKGGTGKTTASDALSALGGAPKSHTHAASDITSGTLRDSRLPTIPLTKGGTGATSGQAGLTNLLAAGYMVLSSYQIVSSVSAIPSNAPNGSLFLVPVEE